MVMKRSPKLPPATPTAQPDPDALARFIAGAPDAGTAAEPPENKPSKRTKKGRRVQISHTLPEALLERIDAAAEALSMSRAAYLNMGAIQLLERGAVIDGAPRKREE